MLQKIKQKNKKNRVNVAVRGGFLRAFYTLAFLEHGAKVPFFLTLISYGYNSLVKKMKLNK